MIEPKEINSVAAINKVSDRQIEKDYILSWMLFGISENKILQKALAFKGGTVLKKAYIRDYRFSEDLDFTLLNESITNGQILDEFHNVFEFIKEEANIDLMIDAKKSKEHKSNSLQFYVDYIGPLKGNMGSRDFKIDITRNEALEFNPEPRLIFRIYTDLEKEFSLNCYTLSEILIEKMAALMGRTEPRDLYDFWYLISVMKLNIKEHTIPFSNKATRKNHNPEHFSEKLLNKENTFKRSWQNKLISQVNNLQDFDTFRQTKRYLKNI